MATDSRQDERVQIENELHIEILPGTEIMTDVGSHHFVKSDDKSHRVLVPQPSNNPHDPLNWSLKWKLCAIVSVSIMSFTQGFAPLSLAPTFGYLAEDFHTSLEHVIQFTGVTVLVLGFSNFIWVPISTSFGRRPVMILSQLVCLASHIWRAKATSYNQFMGAAILSGVGAGPGETIQPNVIADIFFLHDRGKWNTIYWVTYMGSLIIAPVIAGAMAESSGWPSFWWFCAGTTAFSFLVTIFGFPETKFDRSKVIVGRHHEPEVSSKSVEVEHQERLKSGGNSNQSTLSANVEPHVCVGRGRPSRTQWRLFQTNGSAVKSIALDLWLPWKLFSFPIVLFAAFVVSWSCSFLLIINLTQNQVLAAPPYNFSSSKVGFTNFALFAGCLIGLATAGPFSDWVSARATTRNQGIREPEMRLPVMIPYLLVLVIGYITVAVGYQRQWPWEAIVVIGYSCCGIQLAALPSITSTYAVDSYKPVAGSLFVAITVVKNVWGYGMGRFITPWTVADGFINAFILNMALTLIWCLFAILFYFYGHTFRRWTKDSYVHKL